MIDALVAHYGTDEPLPERRLLRAGPVSATLENGALRWIRYGDVEVLRGIAFLVRDRAWGTPTPKIAALKVEEEAAGFRVTFDALCRTDDGDLPWSAEITGSADGTLELIEDVIVIVGLAPSVTRYAAAAGLDGRRRLGAIRKAEHQQRGAAFEDAAGRSVRLAAALEVLHLAGIARLEPLEKLRIALRPSGRSDAAENEPQISGQRFQCVGKSFHTVDCSESRPGPVAGSSLAYASGYKKCAPSLTGPLISSAGTR